MTVNNKIIDLSEFSTSQKKEREPHDQHWENWMYRAGEWCWSILKIGNKIIFVEDRRRVSKQASERVESGHCWLIMDNNEASRKKPFLCLNIINLNYYQTNNLMWRDETRRDETLMKRSMSILRRWMMKRHSWFFDVLAASDALP